VKKIKEGIENIRRLIKQFAKDLSGIIIIGIKLFYLWHRLGITDDPCFKADQFLRRFRRMANNVFDNFKCLKNSTFNFKRPFFLLLVHLCMTLKSF